jgi:ABC-type transporter Mla MlaB component
MKQLNIINQNCLMISGDLTFYTVTTLNQAAIQLLQAHPELSEVSFANVKESDSAALLFLLSLWRHKQANKRPLTFLKIPSQMARLIALSNLEPVLELS